MPTIRGSCDNSRYVLDCEYSYTQDIVNNQSTITAIVYLNGNGYTTYSSYWSVVINGVTVVSGGNWTVSGRREIGRRTWTVNHNSDGTCSTSISFSYNSGLSSAGAYGTKTGTGSSTVTLSTIPRASVLNSVSFNNFWSQFSTGFTTYYSGFTHKLRVSIPNVVALQTFSSYQNGQKVSFSSSVQENIMNRLISSSNISLGFVIETWNGSTKIGESSEIVKTITRPSLSTVSSAGGFNVESPFSITLGRTYSSYRTVLEVLLGGSVIYTATITSSSHTVSFTTSQINTIFSKMSTVNSANFTLKLNNYYGNTLVGYTSTTKVGTIYNATPTMPGFTWQGTNHLELVNTTTIIKGKTDLLVTIQQATAYKGASINRYQVICGTMTHASSSLSVVLKGVNGNSIQVYAIDTRGNSVLVSKTATKYIEYTDVTLEHLEYNRDDSGISTNTTISFNGKLWQQSFDKKSNSIIAKYYYKQDTSTTWIEGVTDISPSFIHAYSYSDLIRGDLGANGFSIDKNFNIRIIVSDLLSSAQREIVIAKGAPTMAIHENGVAFGNFYDEARAGVIQTKDIILENELLPSIAILGGKKYLGTNQNLNTYMQAGMYEQTGNVNASTALNYPVAYAGMLTVYRTDNKNGYVYQTYHTYNNSGFYHRTYYNGTWYAWKKVVDINDSPTFTTLYAGGWYRSTGASGWYSETYAGGIYMADTTYVRVYNSKSFRCEKDILLGSSSDPGSYQLLSSSGAIMDVISRDSSNTIYFGHQTASTAVVLRGTQLYWYSSAIGKTIRITHGDKVHGFSYPSDRGYLNVITDNGNYGVSWWASDSRLKNIIGNTMVIDALELINKLEHKEFQWKETKISVECGYIANQIEEVIPKAVYHVPQPDIDGKRQESLRMIDQTVLIPYITKAIQELDVKYSDEVTKLQKSVEDLKNTNTQLLETINRLECMVNDHEIMILELLKK